MRDDGFTLTGSSSPFATEVCVNQKEHDQVRVSDRLSAIDVHEDEAPWIGLAILHFASNHPAVSRILDCELCCTLERVNGHMVHGRTVFVE